MRYVLDTIEGINLSFGGGINSRKGWINVDNTSTNAEVKHDLNICPYPFESNSISQIEAISVLEHLDNYKTVLMDCYRILKPKGKMLIQVPHYDSFYAWLHWQHSKAFSLFSFDVFVKNNIFYKETNDATLKETQLFNKISRRVTFAKGKWIFGHLYEWLFNINTTMQVFYETWLSGIFKPSGILVVLEK